MTSKWQQYTPGRARPDHHLGGAKALVTIEMTIDSAIHDLLLSASDVDPANIVGLGMGEGYRADRVVSRLAGSKAHARGVRARNVYNHGYQSYGRTQRVVSIWEEAMARSQELARRRDRFVAHVGVQAVREIVQPGKHLQSGQMSIERYSPAAWQATVSSQDGCLRNSLGEQPNSSRKA